MKIMIMKCDKCGKEKKSADGWSPYIGTGVFHLCSSCAAILSKMIYDWLKKG